MGDRAQVAICGNLIEPCKVYLYTNWSGHELYDMIARALRFRVNWNDAEYLARVVFCEMIKGQTDLSAGFDFGIGVVRYGDLDFPVPVLSTADQRVTWEPDMRGRVGKEMSFEEFIAEYAPDGAAPNPRDKKGARQGGKP